MSKFSKLAAVIAAVPVLAFAAPVFADSPGQLQSGDDTYVVRNLTKISPYAPTATAGACEELEYSLQLRNTEFGLLKNIVVRATLPSASAKTNVSTVTATPDSGAAAGTDGSVTVTLDSARTISYEAGKTKLVDGNGNLVKMLPDGITTAAGINVGDLQGSTTEFVDFFAKVNCDTPQTPAYSCDLLHLVVDNDNRKVTVDKFQTSQSNGAAFKQVTLDWGDKTAAAVTSTAVGQSHQFAADGTYKITATASFTVNGDTKTATSESCSQSVTFSSTPNTPPTTPPTTPPQLPNTGAGNVVGIVAAAMAAGTIGYRLFVSRKLSRR